jgi:hypothetical protein
MCSVLDPPRFTTDHQFGKYGNWDPTQGLMVPFEHYDFHAFAFAIDPLTNNSVQIATFGIADTLGDYVIHSYDVEDMMKFTYESGGGLVTTEVESHVLRAEIERSAIAKAFMICLFLGNWAATVSSVYITVLVVFEKLEANSMIAAFPLSALLAIPTIRSLFISPSPLGPPVGKHACVILPTCSAVLIHSTRYSCVLRADCDHRAMFSGLIKGPD